MDVLAKFISLITAIALFFGGIYASFLPKVTQPEDEAVIRELAGFTKPHALADTIYVVKKSNLLPQEEQAAICLQGIVAKKYPCIFISNSSTSDTYLEEIRKNCKTVSFNDENGKPWALSALLSLFRDEIDGYTLYRASEFAEGMNMAFNLATVKNYLAVDERMEETVKALGIPKKEDFTDDKCDMLFQKRFFDQYKNAFDLSAFIHVKDAQRGLRDYAIQQGFFIFYSDFSAGGNILREHIMRNAEKNFALLGWGEYEKKLVKSVSKFGGFVVPADHCRNNSMLASYQAEIPQQTAHKPIPTKSDKHYVAIVFSDGDNLQWVQGGFSEYYQKLRARKDFPMTWTFPILTQEMSPLTVKQVYQAAGENNYFISGPSGLGYIHPSLYPAKQWDVYSQKTASAMLKSDMRIVSLIDEYPNVIAQPAWTYTFDWYSRFDNIDGGILMLDPDRYAGGGGEVWFSGDKPFVCVRFSLWHPDGEGAAVTKEWLQQQADTINAMQADPHSINGYSVINVHPWSVSVQNLCDFVEMLDEHIELVTMEQMIAMLTQNIPHQHAKP